MDIEDFRAAAFALGTNGLERGLWLVRAAVEAGLGATAISASVAAPSLEAGLLHQVQFDLPERGFHVVWHADRYRSKAAEVLVSMVTAPLARPRKS